MALFELVPTVMPAREDDQTVVLEIVKSGITQRPITVQVNTHPATATGMVKNGDRSIYVACSVVHVHMDHMHVDHMHVDDMHVDDVNVDDMHVDHMHVDVSVQIACTCWHCSFVISYYILKMIQELR